MKRNLLNKKIPTAFGILLLLIGIGTGVFFLAKDQLTKSKTNTLAVPRKIYITNVFENQFTVSWITDEKTIGLIKYGETPNLKDAVKDDRDQLSGETNNYLTHYVTIKNLEASKTYYFKIGSNNKLYDNSGQTYSIITSASLGSTGEAKIVSGRVFNPQNTPAEGVIVYLSSANTAPCSALTDKEGRWAIFLNKARTPDLSAYAIIDPEATILKIEAEDNRQNTSAVTITKNAFPVPDMVLGHAAYDFREKPLAEETPLQAQAAPQPSPLESSLEPKEPLLPENSSSPQEATPSQFLVQPTSSPSATPVATVAVTIDNPSRPGEEINTVRPEIRGKGPNFKVLNVKVESPTAYTSTVTVDENGQWHFTPPADLPPGEHTVYVTYVDDVGTTKTLSRNFTVMAAGTSTLPAITATTSAETTVPSPSPVTRVSMPATDSGVPKTGTVTPTFLVFLSGILMIISGFITIFVIDKRKANLS